MPELALDCASSWSSSILVSAKNLDTEGFKTELLIEWQLHRSHISTTIAWWRRIEWSLYLLFWTLKYREHRLLLYPLVLRSLRLASVNSRRSSQGLEQVLTARRFYWFIEYYQVLISRPPPKTTTSNGGHTEGAQCVRAWGRTSST